MNDIVKIFFQLPLSLQHIINSKTRSRAHPARSHLASSCPTLLCPTMLHKESLLTYSHKGHVRRILRPKRKAL